MGTARGLGIKTFTDWDGPSQEDGPWRSAPGALSVCARTSLSETVSETLTDLVLVVSGDPEVLHQPLF